MKYNRTQPSSGSDWYIRIQSHLGAAHTKELCTYQSYQCKTSQRLSYNIWCMSDVALAETHCWDLVPLITSML